MKVASITIGLLNAEIRCTYDVRAVELIKSFPGKMWDPARKTWRVPAEFAAEIAVHLRVLGFQVTTTRPGQKHAPPTPPRPAPPQQRTWAEHLLEAVGSERREPVVRALTKVLHPDITTTGDTVLMRQLLDARSKAVSR